MQCHCLIKFTSGVIGQCVYLTICCPACDVINVEIILSFLTKPFYYKIKKSQCLNILRMKRAFDMKMFHQF